MRLVVLVVGLVMGAAGCGSQGGRPPEITSAEPVPSAAVPTAVVDASVGASTSIRIADAGEQPTAVDAPSIAPTTGAPEPATATARPARTANTEMRCTLRVSAKGIYVDGDAMTQDEAIALCKRRASALVVLEDGVPSRDWNRVEAALRAAKVPIIMRGPVGDADCWDNPLAKGCQ